MLTKQKYKKQMARILTALLVVAVGIGFVPQMDTQVYADNRNPGMSSGVDALAAGMNTANAQILFYGGKKWCVINTFEITNGSDGLDNSSNKWTWVQLLSKEILGYTQFKDEQTLELQPDSYENAYSGSKLQSYINSFLPDGTNEILTYGEQSAIEPETLLGGSSDYNDGPYYSEGCIKGDAVESAFLRPLLNPEAEKLADSIRICGENQNWWLCNPGENVTYVAVVHGNEVVFSGKSIFESSGVRPTFQLDSRFVLFTSAAEGGKVSIAEGAGALKEVGTNSTNEWKATVQYGHEDFKLSKCRPAENGVSVTYTGAKIGTVEEPEYISAVIKDSSGNITYYGRIQECTSESDTVTINTAGKLEDGDMLYVFNEQYNGDKKTDYASALKEVTIPDPISYDVTFKVENGSWNDGTKEEKKVTLAGYEGDTLKLEPNQIPAVGNNPNQNYTAGSWDVMPSEETVITGKTTYTYTYEPAPSSPSTSIDNAPVVLDDAPLVYTGQPVTPVIQTIGGKTLDPDKDYTVRYTQGDTLIEAPIDAGTYTMTITGKGNFAGSTSTEFTIEKADGTLTAQGNKVKARSKTIKLKKPKKISADKAYTIEGTIGELAFSKVKASKKAGKFKVNATTGQIKAKKGLKKGRYKLTVLISDPGDKNHETAEAKAVVTIKIKR